VDGSVVVEVQEVVRILQGEDLVVGLNGSANRKVATTTAEDPRTEKIRW
jgi:hypothetical protein